MKKILSNAAQRLQWWSLMEEHWQVILSEAANISQNPNDQELKTLLRIEALDVSYLRKRTKKPIELSAIRPLIHLKKLVCSYNDIRDLSPIAHLTNIETLVCKGNFITDVSPLQHLSNLRFLDISGCMFEGGYITDISPLQSLTKLQVLDCSKLQLTDISPVANLVQLREFYFAGGFNKIQDYSALNNLPNLHKFSCTFRKLKIKPLFNFEIMTL